MRSPYLPSFILITLWVILIVCFYTFFSMSDRTFESFFFEIYNFIQKNGVLGAIFFIIIYCLRPLFFIIASPFDILSGLIFGFWGGLLISILANIFSTAFSYFVGYMTGGKYISIPKGFLKLKKIEGKIRENTFFNILMIRLTGFPFDLLNYLSGVFSLPFKKFWMASVFGSLPFILIFITAGSAFHKQDIYSFKELKQHINYDNLYISIVMLLSFLIAVQLCKYYLKHKKQYTL